MIYELKEASYKMIKEQIYEHRQITKVGFYVFV